MTPLEFAEQWAGVLSTAGIRATTDPRDVVPPCVLFLPPEQVDVNLYCGGTADMRAVLLSRGPGQVDAWRTLETTLPAILDLLPVETVRSTTYQIDSSGPMPAYELQLTATVSWKG